MEKEWDGEFAVTPTLMDGDPHAFPCATGHIDTRQRGTLSNLPNSLAKSYDFAPPHLLTVCWFLQLRLEDWFSTAGESDPEGRSPLRFGHPHATWMLPSAAPLGFFWDSFLGLGRYSFADERCDAGRLLGGP
jgi:hypothetical protein